MVVILKTAFSFFVVSDANADDKFLRK